ncbi:hypothetical protein PIROE2DRAFT_41126, partial [Piromyces sp. E2]
MYHEDLVESFDYNYYFPSSAGEDVDIVVLDTSFNFDYVEFKKPLNHIAKCRGYVGSNSKVIEVDSTSCGDLSHSHGRIVSDIVAGAIHGTAKNANIYGVSIPESEDYYIYMKDVLPALQYVLDYLIRPNKTVINISHRFLFEKGGDPYNQYNDVINDIVRKGGIVVVSAGNDENDTDHNSKNGAQTIPCALSNTICVGGIDSDQTKHFEKNYVKANGSNYGKSVDVWAPYIVNASILDGSKVITNKYYGTSFSAPLTAGI